MCAFALVRGRSSFFAWSGRCVGLWSMSYGSVDSTDLLSGSTARRPSGRSTASGDGVVEEIYQGLSEALRPLMGDGEAEEEDDGEAEDMDGLMACVNPITSEDDPGRYYKLNLRTGKKNTIEFRAHSGTTDTEKLKRWINFVVAFVENSARNPEPLSFYDDRDAVHKFHRLFEWVVRGNSIYNFYYERALELNQY